MSKLEAYNKRRSNIKGSLTKILNYIKTQREIEGCHLDQEELKIRLRRVETLLINFQEVEHAITELNVDDVSQLDDFEDKDYSAVAELNRLLRSATLAAGNISSDLHVTQPDQSRFANLEVKLPKINIEPFYGCYTEWQSFYDLFTSTVHGNPNLNPAHKFQYLKGLLREEAANLLKHLPISDANYIEALNKLKARYDLKRYTVQSFIKNLIEIPSITNPTSQQLRRIMDTADEVVRGLKAIGPEAETRDPWLIYLIITKLDEETRERWANETAAIEFPTCQLLIDFLLKRADALDSVKGYIRKTSTQVKNVKTFTNTFVACTVCKNESHPIIQCPTFKEWTVQKRREFIREESRCFNCLRSDENEANSNQAPTSNLGNAKCTTTMDAQPRQFTCCHITPSRSLAVLPTATVKIKDRNGQYQLCRALLDSGFQTSLITEAFLQRLGLERRNGRICIQGVGNQKLVNTKGIVDIIITPHMESKFVTDVSPYVVPLIATINPIQEADGLHCKCVSSLHLADIGLNSASKIDLLIGADKFFELLKSEPLKDSNNKIYAHNTHLGWILTGHLEHSHQYGGCNTVIIDNSSLDETLKWFWQSEEVFKETPLLPEHQHCEELFKSTTVKLADKHYMVRLPLKESLGIAIKRLASMERKFNLNPNLQRSYVEFMEEYIRLGHMVEVEPSNHTSDYIYLPHHGVWKETSTTTKLRVVFDASAKTTSGNSLNDNLLTGPILQNLLSDILIRFRVHRIAFTADAEKMFRQIWIHPEDLKYQRLVWRKSPNANIKHFELRTLTYGMSSAPYLATRIIKHIAETSMEQYPIASQALSRDMYIVHR